MDRYFAVVDDRRGEWTSGPTTEVYTFEVEDDQFAKRVMASYLKRRTGWGLLFLSRITSGIKVEEIEISDDLEIDTIELSQENLQDLDFASVFVGQRMLSQLQAFDPEVRTRRLEAIEERRKKDEEDRARVAAMPLPKVGEDVYVPSALHLSHGCDDVVGGLARVKSVSTGVSRGEQAHFISVIEIPGGFNWEHHLALQQDKLKREFGENRAYPNPDYRPEFNEP